LGVTKRRKPTHLFTANPLGLFLFLGEFSVAARSCPRYNRTIFIHKSAPMDKKTIVKMEALLLKEHDRLKKEIESVAVKNPEGAEDSYEAVRPEYDGTSSDEDGAEETLYETNVALKGQLQEDLREIDAALARIERGKYGVCEVCGKDIPEERLEALPEARGHLECM